MQLILLNGASSAGKTVLSKKLMQVLNEPYLHLEEDCFVFNTNDSRFIEGELAPEIFRKTMLGYYRSLRACLSAEQNVLADTGFYSRALLDTFTRELEGERVWMVAVDCSPEELERREQARQDRPAGLAREQFATIHTDVLYDVRVDTSAADLETCAMTIKDVVERAGTPTALEKMWRRLNAIA